MKKERVDKKDLMCPRCLTTMRKIKKADIIIDVCDSCHGMWLDDGELEKLVKWGKKKYGKKE